MYIVSIDKQIINQMDVVSFPGDIHVISSISQVKSAVNALRTASIVGFDTETRPCFRRGERHPVALLQLSTATDAFLFRVNKTGVPAPLKEFLEDETCIKVGLSTSDDFHQLASICDCRPAGFIELQELVKQFSITDMSLQKIYAILFQMKISKGQQLSNWEAPQLTDAQQRYAAIDAWACLKIYEYLQSGAFTPQQSPYWHELIEEENQ
ncbi:MAG: 3'-5' exonuclease domain-containing protein 2 [Muribaculaceae bacterium]|nr:3'-5' exonuclease domain-containing protein 2 [Muribaculaceae bacterium]